MLRAGLSLLLAAGLSLSGCTRPRTPFSEQNARNHVRLLAESIGSRPAGTSANARARRYVIDELRRSGFDVRVQETDAQSRELGLTARVANVIGVLPGSRREAIGLLSHLDSVPEAPGAGDDALGVAVALETARIVADTPNRTWSTMVIVTDGEELGLLGATALTGDRDVTERLQAYLNIESIGLSGVPVLFEAGPGNQWLVDAWARYAPHPRGGSYAIEIYKRLPNDTDFSIVKTLGIPGLNFAAVGDSYAYHTARDTAARLSAETVAAMGHNAVGIVQGLQQADITQRSLTEGTFFDIGGMAGVSYGAVASRVLPLAALFFAALAWARLMRTALRASGVWRWLLTAIWTSIAAAAVPAAMIGATWLLRASREVYHPWYAHPDRLAALLVAVGATAGWAAARAGWLLPPRVHARRGAALTWTLTLPVWTALAAATLWTAPAASYLWTLPTLAAGLLFTVLPPHRDAALRGGSLVVLVVAGALWLREGHELMRFLVPVMGRFPVITPVFIYPALLAATGLMLVPPLVATVAPSAPLSRPPLLTALLLFAVAVTAGLAYAAPAYTPERPLRRHVRAIQDGPGTSAIWEVGSVEPGLDLADGAPAGFAPAHDEAAVSVPWGRLNHPFVFRAMAHEPLGEAPAEISSFTVSPLPAGTEISVTVRPKLEGSLVTFVLPAGLVPTRSNLPGRLRETRWVAAYAAPPEEGVTLRASFSRYPTDAADGMRVAVRLPWRMAQAGEPPVTPPQAHLPRWIPQERAVWGGGATWVLPLPLATAAALR